MDGELHDGKHGRAPEELKRPMDERLEEDEEGQEQKGGFGERGEGQREENEDLEEIRESSRDEAEISDCRNEWRDCH